MAWPEGLRLVIEPVPSQAELADAHDDSIVKTPGVCGGDARIKGTRITVWGLEEWRRLGWSDVDLAGEGSERLLDAVIAIGDVDEIVKRAADHLAAGADHVCVQLREEKSSDPGHAFRPCSRATGPARGRSSSASRWATTRRTSGSWP